MTLQIVNGQIQNKNFIPPISKPPKYIAPGVAMHGTSFFTSDGEGDLGEYLESLRKNKKFKTVTLDTRFYVLWKLKRKLGKNFTIRSIREYIQSIPNPHTQKKTRRCLMCYAIFRNQQGDPSLLAGILSDPELRPSKLYL